MATAQGDKQEPREKDDLDDDAVEELLFGWFEDWNSGTEREGKQRSSH